MSTKTSSLKRFALNTPLTYVAYDLCAGSGIRSEYSSSLSRNLFSSVSLFRIDLISFIKVRTAFGFIGLFSHVRKFRNAAQVSCLVLGETKPWFFLRFAMFEKYFVMASSLSISGLTTLALRGLCAKRYSFAL